VNTTPRFEELPHTADWAMRVTAPDLAGLFAESARGMNALAGVKLALSEAEGFASVPKTHRTLNLSAPDTEGLLVAFLSELVYSAEQERLAFDELDIKVEGKTLKAEMSGAPILSLNKSIKAVTYHNLHIRQTARGYEVEIVFDV
jgi:SHS2 domain-containing protein